MELDDKLDSVCDYRTLSAFISALSDDLIANEAGWENRTLQDYLERLSAFTGAMGSWARNNNVDLPHQENVWKLFGEMLLIAREYE
jgi:hypothetical protein